MDQRNADTLADYRQKGFASRSGWGRRPALLVVDFINGFTDPQSPLGGDYTAELTVTAELLAAFRARELPVVYTTIVYEPHFRDAGVFIKKIPSLAVLVRGSRLCEIDERIAPARSDIVLQKKFASAFFDTALDSRLRALGVDTVVIAGCTTSGCIRASAVDSLQYGFHTIVVRDAVGDRAEGPHQANLFDIDAKYGDVVSGRAVLDHLAGGGAAGGLAAAAEADFRRWWRGGSAA